MHTETTVILRAEEGKILQNKETGIQTPSVWLKVGDNQDDWEEIDIPVVEEEENTIEKGDDDAPIAEV